MIYLITKVVYRHLMRYFDSHHHCYRVNFYFTMLTTNAEKGPHYKGIRSDGALSPKPWFLKLQLFHVFFDLTCIFHKTINTNKLANKREREWNKCMKRIKHQADQTHCQWTPLSDVRTLNSDVQIVLCPRTLPPLWWATISYYGAFCDWFLESGIVLGLLLSWMVVF